LAWLTLNSNIMINKILKYKYKLLTTLFICNVVFLIGAVVALYFDKGALENVYVNDEIIYAPFTIMILGPIIEELYCRGLIIIDKSKVKLRNYLTINLVLTPVWMYSLLYTNLRQLITFGDNRFVETYLLYFILLFLSSIFSLIVYILIYLTKLTLVIKIIESINTKYIFWLTMLGFVFIHVQPLINDPLFAISLIISSVILTWLCKHHGLKYAIIFHIYANTSTVILFQNIAIIKELRPSPIILIFSALTWVISVGLLLRILIKNVKLEKKQNLI
jgi:hypothetical protein